MPRADRNDSHDTPLRGASVAATESNDEGGMDTDKNDPLAQFGLDAIDLRWTLKDIDSQRKWLINADHLPRLIELGLVEMRDGVPHLTLAGQNAAWRG